jgi:hypothetical protein
MSKSELFTSEEVVEALTRAEGVVARAAQILGCSRQSVYRYRDRYEEVEKCLSHFDEDPKPSSKTAQAPSELDANRPQGGYSESEVRDYLASNLGTFSTKFGDYFPEDVFVEYKASRQRIDVFARRRGGKYSIIEVKTEQSYQNADLTKTRYILPGQLLWYHDWLTKERCVNDCDIELVAAIDWKPSPRFRRVLDSVGKDIQVLELQHTLAQ